MAAKYELQDLPKFGDDKNKDPFEFMYQFDNFLRYINLNITSPAQVENVIQLFGSCMHKEARSYFETHIGPTPTNEEGVKVQKTIADWNKIKENFVKRFHPLGRTTEQLEFKWNNLKWSPQLESIKDYVQKINQLATALGKTEPDKVLKLKISAPNQEIYLFIMTCTTTEEIVAAINKFQAMSYFFKSNTPGLNPPTTQTTNYAVAAQQVKSVSFAPDTQNKNLGWAKNLENKLSDQMTKLTNSHMRDIEMTPMMTDMMTVIMTAMMTDMMVTNQDVVMVIEKKEIESMRTMVLIERDIDPPVDMILGNQKGI